MPAASGMWSMTPDPRQIPEPADQRPWPSYGTRQAAASPAHRRRRSATRPSVTCPCGTASSLPTTSARPPSGRTTSTSSRSPGDSSTCEPSVTRRLRSSRRPASMSPRRGASLNPGRPPQNRNDQTPSGLRAYPYRHRSVARPLTARVPPARAALACAPTCARRPTQGDAERSRCCPRCSYAETSRPPA